MWVVAIAWASFVVAYYFTVIGQIFGQSHGENHRLASLVKKNSLSLYHIVCHNVIGDIAISRRSDYERRRRSPVFSTSAVHTD